MRAFIAAALASLAVVVAGCGGTSSTGSAGDPLGSAAQLVPADALAFAAIDTDQSSQQWKQLDTLTQGLGARTQLMQTLNAALAQHGLSYGDVQPAVGKELDVAVLKGSGTTPEVVAFAKPSDQSKLKALASKFDQGSDHYTVEEIGGWSVIADSPDIFSAVRAAQNGGSLGDTSAYKSAQSQLSGNAIARFYASSGALASLAKQPTTAGGTAPDWAAATIAVGSDAIRASAAVAGDAVPAAAAQNLLRDVPSGAALAVAFSNGSDLASALGSSTAKTALPLQQLTPLLTGPGVVYVRANGLIPDVAAELAPADPQTALGKARSALAGAADKLGPVQLSAQLVDGKLVIADSPRAASALHGGAKLVNDAAFKDALKAAGAPQRPSALVYADVPQLTPFLQLAVQALGGKPLDPTVTDTLDHVGSLVAWAAHSGNTSHFELWARRR